MPLAVGSSTTYACNFNETQNYYAIVGSDVIWVGNFYATNKITLMVANPTGPKPRIVLRGHL